MRSGAASVFFPLFGLVLTVGAADAQTPPEPGAARPLVIPQVEGERQGKVLGRALTEERYALALDDAMRLETSLPAPSSIACEKALAGLERLEKAP